MKKFLLLLLFSGLGYSVFANATVTQKGWRWRNDDGSETTATWAAEKNQQMVLKSTDANIRLRIEFLVEDDPQNSDPSDHEADYRISYATSPGGPFTFISSTASTGQHFVLSGSGVVTNGTPTTQQLLVGIPGQPFIAGKIVDKNETGPYIIFTTPNAENRTAEYEWVIKPTANISTNTYYFKLAVDGHDSPLPSLSYTAPTVNTAPTITSTEAGLRLRLV